MKILRASQGLPTSTARCLVAILMATVINDQQVVSAAAQDRASNLPVFEVATIKPPDPNEHHGHVGFSGDPGGRIFFGGDLKLLVQTAFELDDYQISGGPDWTASRWFVINAVPPESSSSRKIQVQNANATLEQTLMLQSLLRDRFGFKYHFDSKRGEVYVLARGSKPLQLTPAKDKSADPRAVVMMKQDNIADGEAMGRNTTTDYLAKRCSRYLQIPVENKTGIAGSYDFYLPADDPENTDRATAVFNAMNRLGLTLKRARGPIKTLVIDHVEPPSEN